MSNKLRVAMIGAGNHSTSVHYPSLHRLDDVELCAVSELSEERMSKVRDQYRIPKGYTDYVQMIEKEAPDAVYLVMPPQALFPHALKCLELGANLFVEKPPGLNVEQARHLARKAEARNCITMCGFQRRYAPLVAPALEEARRRGGVDMIVSSFYKFYDDPSGYFGGEVDILTSDCIHAVDLLRYAGGEIQSMASDVRERHKPYPNFFTSLIRFKTGATGILQGNWQAGMRVFSCEVHARGMTDYINVEVESRRYTDGNPEARITTATEAAGSEAIFMRGGFFAQNKLFMDSIRAKRQPPNNLTDAVQTMELVERIYRETL